MSGRAAAEPPYFLAGEARAPRVKSLDSSPILSRLRHSRSRLTGFATKTKALAQEIPPATQAKHKGVRKFTWESPNPHRDRNQIDHIAINGRYRRSLLNATAMRDAGSDHHLVISKLRLKLTRYRGARTGKRLMLDTAVRLKSPTVRKAFLLE